MKKVLALVLALVLVLSLAACGGVGKSADSTVHSIGDTVKTDVAEVVVKNVSFVDTFNDCVSDSDHQYVSVTFSFKNIGKTTISQIDISNGFTAFVYEIPFVDYNNGYCFYVGDVKASGHNYDKSLYGDERTLVDDLEPLSEAKSFTSAIYVPNEVAENTSAPLLIKIYVPKSKGSEVFTYKVR